MNRVVRQDKIFSCAAVPLLALAVAVLAAGSVRAQAPPAGGQISTPQSSIEQPGDVGVRAHTNIQIFTPNPASRGAQTLPGSGHPAAPASPSPQAPGTTAPDAPAQPPR